MFNFSSLSTRLRSKTRNSANMRAPITEQMALSGSWSTWRSLVDHDTSTMPPMLITHNRQMIHTHMHTSISSLVSRSMNCLLPLHNATNADNTQQTNDSHPHAHQHQFTSHRLNELSAPITQIRFYLNASRSELILRLKL